MPNPCLLTGKILKCPEQQESEGGTEQTLGQPPRGHQLPGLKHPRQKTPNHTASQHRPSALFTLRPGLHLQHRRAPRSSQLSRGEPSPHAPHPAPAKTGRVRELAQAEGARRTITRGRSSGAVCAPGSPDVPEEQPREPKPNHARAGKPPLHKHDGGVVLGCPLGPQREHTSRQGPVEL